MRRNVTLMGEGMGTILQQSDNTNVAVISPHNEKEYPLCIRDLRIRGTKSPSGGGENAHGILLDTLPASGGFTVPDGQHIIDKVWVETSYAGNIVIANSCRGTLVSDCWLSSSQTAGGLLIDGSDSIISNTISRSHSGVGFTVTSGNARLLNCKAFFCRSGGFTINGSRANVSVCEAQDNWNDGFQIMKSDCMLGSCLADSNQHAGFHINPQQGGISGICMNGFMALGRLEQQSSKPWVGQPVGVLLSGGIVNDSYFAGTARKNSIAQVEITAQLDENSQMGQIVQSQ